jgi:hypothetical protein
VTWVVRRLSSGDGDLDAVEEHAHAPTSTASEQHQARHDRTPHTYIAATATPPRQESECGPPTTNHASQRRQPATTHHQPPRGRRTVGQRSQYVEELPGERPTLEDDSSSSSIGVVVVRAVASCQGLAAALVGGRGRVVRVVRRRRRGLASRPSPSEDRLPLASPASHSTLRLSPLPPPHATRQRARARISMHVFLGACRNG